MTDSAPRDDSIAAAPLSSHFHVVDETGAAKPRRGEHHDLWVAVLWRLEVGPPAHRDVIGAPAVVRELSHRFELDALVIARTLEYLALRFLQNAVEPRRFLPLLRREEAVARGQRQSVVSAHRVRRND